VEVHHLRWIVSVGSKSTAKQAKNNSRERTSSEDASLQKKTKIKNVKFQDENNGPATLAQSVEAEELLDVDANVQTIGATCSTRPTWLTEGGEEEVVIVSTVEAQQRFEATQQSASLCDFTKQISVESVKPNVKADQELTMFKCRAVMFRIDGAIHIAIAVALMCLDGQRGECPCA
jgi:hypothetical protein